MRKPAAKSARSSKPRPALLFARLNPGVALENDADGTSAIVHGDRVRLGRFSPEVAKRSSDLTSGLRLGAPALAGTDRSNEICELVRRLSRGGLVEYRLARSRSGPDLVVVEPQVRDYVPQFAALEDDTPLALSRFAFMRRRGTDIVLESPRAGALFRLCDPELAAMIALMSRTHKVKQLRRLRGFAGIELLALLVESRILLALESDRDQGLRASEGDANLVLWDFHDLLFHARSTAGRHANPLGGMHAYAHHVAALPAIRPTWDGRAVDLRPYAPPPTEDASPLTSLLRRRRSMRSFDEQHPITLSDLSRFLHLTARIISHSRMQFDDDPETEIEIAARPYPSGGASYELELYLAVNCCEGLEPGFYHYDAAYHALTAIEASAQQLKAMLGDAQFAMGAADLPQILVTIAARFGRVSLKYSAIAYALILKHVGVLMQTFYLMATEMELGACAIGFSDIDLFARMTGIEFQVEGPVGQIAIGRAAPEPPATAAG